MDEQEKSLELAIAYLDKQYGKGSVIRVGSTNIEPWAAVSTGSLSLDLALGIGGLPRGRIVEIFGPESSGKSTICLSVISQAQRMGCRCAFIDAEHALDPSYARALGVDMDDLYLAQPSNGEEALDILDTLVRTGALAVIVVDSVAALTPKAELDGKMEDQQMGLQARLMSKAMRKIIGIASETKTLVIFTNQIREKMTTYGNPETQPGGRALKFAASVRIDLRKKEDLKEKSDGRVNGVRVQAKIVKNKMAPPLRVTMLDIVYGKGINTLGGLVDLAIDREILTSNGSWIKWAGSEEVLAQGRAQAVERLASDLDLADKLKERVLSVVS
ncbi:MAG TPA: recombinase RecA [Nitrososphaera sp.]|nr:recombinase RecA [Nitrososphaera sp.]